MTTQATLSRAALALSDWLATAGPDVLAALEHALPAAILDQHHAATRDARTALHATRDGADLRGITPAAAPEWLRLSITDTLTRYAARATSTCLHIDPARPQPLFAAAWRPDLVTCLHCARLFRLPNTADDRRCDRCGIVADAVHPNRVAVGELIFAWGQCPDCQNEWPGGPS